MEIKKELEYLTGFSVPFEFYEFNLLPFGLSNSQAKFQRLMDKVVKVLVGIECSVYIDDVIVFSITADENARILENVLHDLKG